MKDPMNLCGCCNNQAIGKITSPNGSTAIKVCAIHKKRFLKGNVFEGWKAKDGGKQ